MSKKRVSGAWVDDTPHIYNTSTETFTTLPHEVIGDGQSNLTWSMDGNMQVNGTPTPQNPITPAEVGEKTANLSPVGSFTITAHDTSQKVDIFSGTLEAGDYVVALNQDNAITGSTRNTLQVTFGGRTYYNSANPDYHNQSGQQEMTFTVAETGNVEVKYWANDLNENCTYSNVTFNAGTEVINEPYGYKIPILSNGVTYPIYLSEPIRKIGDSVDTAPSTGAASRIVVKQRVTQASSINQFSRGFTVDISFAPKNQTIYSNIAVGTDEPPAAANRDGKVWINASKEFIGVGATEQFPISGNNPTQAEIDVFNTYLQSNEVYVWYVLATAQTETFTAPSIPTSGTAQTFDVDTTLKPSEVSLTWHGWHEHSDTKFTTP